MLYLGDETKFPPPFEALRQIRNRVGDLPLVVPMQFPDFQSALIEHRLLGGVFYRVRNVPGVDTANRCMDLVRGYVA